MSFQNTQRRQANEETTFVRLEKGKRGGGEEESQPNEKAKLETTDEDNEEDKPNHPETTELEDQPDGQDGVEDR